LQYLQRWNVSRPGSGWDGVGPLRFVHAMLALYAIWTAIANRIKMENGKLIIENAEYRTGD